MKQEGLNSFKLDWKRLNRQIPSWFRDAKFGLFFHWGPYCVPAYKNEWYSRNMYNKGLDQYNYHQENYGAVKDFGYKDFYQYFTGEKFNAEAWADLIVHSGAKYAGPVAEHADNFSMWNSNVNSINSVNYGPKIDIVGEMEKAIRDRGLNFIVTFHHQWLWGWFMSTIADADVYIPENEKYYGKALPLETNRYLPWRLPDDEFNEQWLKKVIEVVDKYNPDLVYFDSRANIIDEKYKYKLLDHLYNDSAQEEPKRIISFKQEDFPKGTGIFDIECGCFSDIAPSWQIDDRLEDKTTWCYVKNPRYKSAKTIIHQLCDVVSKNGNLLLNVGPKVNGTFDDDAVNILHKIGDWLSLNGEAIYGTRPYKIFGEGEGDLKKEKFDVDKIEKQLENGVFEEENQGDLDGSDIRFTTKNNNLYAIIMGIPDNNKVYINSLAKGEGSASKKIASVEMIGGRQNLNWELTNKYLAVEMNTDILSKVANVLKITYKN